MKYEVIFRKEAQQDILEAIAWYESRREGLGDELFIALENAKHLIEQNPYHFEDKYKSFKRDICIIPDNRIFIISIHSHFNIPILHG